MSVDELKETIKAKNIDLFEGIGSRSLILCKVCVISSDLRSDIRGNTIFLA